MSLILKNRKRKGKRKRKGNQMLPKKQINMRRRMDIRFVDAVLKENKI